MNTVMLIFFGTLAVAVAVYYLFPKRLRWTVLLFFSALFCVIVSTYLFAFFLATAASVYAAARFLLRPAPEGADEQTQKKFARRNKAFTALVIVFNLAIIGVLKYANFFGGMFNSLLALTGTQFRFPALSLALPLGISFYTLTAIGYMVDIALGSAELFGVRLPENFRQPFFAKSAQEFWQRWHITLGVWLKEYVFYSVALSPRVTGPAEISSAWTNAPSAPFSKERICP